MYNGHGLTVSRYNDRRYSACNSFTAVGSVHVRCVDIVIGIPCRSCARTSKGQKLQRPEMDRPPLITTIQLMRLRALITQMEKRRKLDSKFRNLNKDGFSGGQKRRYVLVGGHAS